MRLRRWIKGVAEPLLSQLVYSTSAYTDLKSTNNEVAGSLMDFSSGPKDDSDQSVYAVAKLLAPCITENMELVRVGGEADGGYLMIKDFNVSGVISIGVGRNVSWDQAVSNQNIPIVLFDPTIRRLPSKVPNSRFLRLGVSGNPAKSDYKTLEELIGLARFNGQEDLLLKMDVEGSEWECLEVTRPETLTRFRQMIFEFHDFHRLLTSGQSERVINVLSRLRQGHMPIHVHANNYGRVARYGRYWFPDALEVTYARRDLFDSDMRRPSLPSLLDRPCDPRVSDIDMKHVFDTFPLDEIRNAADANRN